MVALIQVFKDGSRLEYDQGKFDAWCIYLSRPHRPRYAPKDIEYFAQLRDWGLHYSAQKVYTDFMQIYFRVTPSLEPAVLARIEHISQTYADNDRLEIAIVFTILYAGMIAEENKAHAILKKRVKRLGLHQILFDGFSPEHAASFSKGKTWREIDDICKQKGF